MDQPVFYVISIWQLSIGTRRYKVTLTNPAALHLDALVMLPSKVKK